MRSIKDTLVWIDACRVNLADELRSIRSYDGARNPEAMLMHANLALGEVELIEISMRQLVFRLTNHVAERAGKAAA